VTDMNEQLRTAVRDRQQHAADITRRMFPEPHDEPHDAPDDEPDDEPDDAA